MASPSSPSHSQPRRSSRMLLPLSSTGVSVPINVQSQMPHQQYYNSSNINESPPQVSHPYRMSAQAYADLSRSRSNSVQSLPKDELSDSSINSSPPSGGTTPVPPGRYQTVDHIPAATPRYPGQEVYSPNSASTGFRVSMDPASSAPSRRDTWASSYSGSHHGHTNSSPPPPLPQQRKLPLPGEPSPAYPTPITFHPDQAAQLPQLENSPPVTSSSTILAPPTLKLDLDFGSGSLFDDFSFGSLGLDSNTFSTPPPNVSPGPPASTTLASETPSREDEGKLRPDSVATQNTVTGGTEQEKSWLDPDSSPSTVTTGTFDHSSASISQNEWTTSTSADSSFAGAKAEEATSVALPASRPMSHLDLNSSSDSLSPERQLPAGAARVPIASPSGGPSQHSTLHSRHTSEDKSHLPPPRGSSMARSTSPQDTNRSRQSIILFSVRMADPVSAEHVRKSSKESVGSSVLSINRSKTSLQSPTSPTIRSSIRSATPDTTPEPSSQAPSNSLHRPLSNLALNKNLPPPPPPGQMDVEASMHSAETSTSSLARSLLRKPTGPRELDQHTSESPRVPPPETNGLPPRPNTAPQNTSSPHQKKNSLLGNSSAASHLINRSKGLLHRSTSSVASSIQSELPVHQSVADIDGSSPQADKCFPRNTRSSLANYFNSQPGRPTSSSLSSLAAQAEPSEPPPSHQPQSRPVLGSNRRDSGDSTTSEEFGAANLVSMSTARRDVERRIERQKELEAKEKTKEMEKERHSRKHVSSKPPPPVDLDESSKRPSTDKLLVRSFFFEKKKFRSLWVC